MAEDPTDPDRELVERVQRELPDRTRAFQDLVERHSRVVFGRAYRILRVREDAEDATQETFLNVFRAIPDFRFDRPFAHWLNKITLNTTLLVLARRQREQRRRAALAREPGTAAPRMRSDPILESRLESWLAEIPPRARAALVLRYVEERSYPEIARLLDVKESAVKMQVARALDRLRALVGRGPE